MATQLDGVPMEREPDRSRSVQVKLTAGGRIVIPAAYRRQRNLNVRDDLTLWLEDGELRLTTPAQAVARAQATIREYVPAGHSLVDEPLAKRRGNTARV